MIFQLNRMFLIALVNGKKFRKLESSDIIDSIVNVSKESHGYIHGNPVFNNDTGDTSFVVER